MGDLFWNKVAAAVIGLVLMVMVIGILGDVFFPEQHGDEDHATLAYPIDLEAVMGGTGGAGPVEEVVVDLGALLVNANASAGERTFRRCVSCHNSAPGAGNLQGPNLWNIVNREGGTYPDFSYSSAISEHGPWTYEELDHFIANPRSWVPGTSMAFAGIRNDQDRADLLAYLQTLSDNPAPFPAPAPVEDDMASGEMTDAVEGDLTEAVSDVEDQLQALEDASGDMMDDQADQGEMPEDGGN
jgi:cytochrome c